jgi:hypothetical protein
MEVNPVVNGDLHRIIFLDVDGVLGCSRCIMLDFEEKDLV